MKGQEGGINSYIVYPLKDFVQDVKANGYDDFKMPKDYKLNDNSSYPSPNPTESEKTFHEIVLDILNVKEGKSLDGKTTLPVKHHDWPHLIKAPQSWKIDLTALQNPSK